VLGVDGDSPPHGWGKKVGAEGLYRPGKQAVMRALGFADADVIAWRKKDGQGYHFPQSTERVHYSLRRAID
jgi:hypothetical protein